jgi:YD repeat-containing protein
MRSCLLVAFACLLPTSLFAPAAAQAACVTTGTDVAYGGYWVEREADGDCVVKQRTYSCVATGGFRTQSAPITVGTVTHVANRACEDSAGYDSVIATARSNITSGYKCDATVTDADGDNYPSCIDHNDQDPRVWVKINASETVFDGVDNDGDGTIDDGFGSTGEKDHKRPFVGSAMQGSGGDWVNVVEGQYLRREHFAMAAGPYAALAFDGTYNALRTDNPAAMGRGWVHNWAIHVVAMPAGDDRMMVETGSGHRDFFRCTTITGGSTKECVIDDHRPGGNLSFDGTRWIYYPGDGTQILFGTTSYDSGTRYLWDEIKNGAGQRLAKSSADGSGRVTKVESANSSIYLHFSYDANGLDLVRINSTSSKQILDFDLDTSGFTKLDLVKFASAVGTIDADARINYDYNATTKRLETIKEKLDGSTERTVASITYDSDPGKALTLKSASLDLSFAYSTGATDVTYNIEASGNPTTTFYHNNLWVSSRSAPEHVGGMAARSEVRDDHGKLTCKETDDSRMTKLIYSDSTVATRVDIYGKSGDCASGGTVDRKIWHSYDWNTATQSYRPKWTRRKSIYSPASDCTGASLPAGCTELKFDYLSSTDDRVQWITRTGSTRTTNGYIAQEIRKERSFYFGVDTGVCTSGDSYSGLPCREETQDNGGTVFARTDFTYVASGATAGLLKTLQLHDKTSDPAPLTTTFASHNDFGTPTSVTSPTGVVTTYAFNGWSAVTSITETGALLDDAFPTPGTLTPVTTFSYTKHRRIDTVTLPKGNKQRSIYDPDEGGYLRLKAQATADASGNLLEISRLVYDKLGNVIEDRTLDSINGTTPCADESCSTYDVRRERKYNALRQVTEAYLHAADQSNPPDGTMHYTYTDGKLSAVEDYLGTDTLYTFDDQGRIATHKRDDGGLNAVTSYAYDA